MLPLVNCNFSIAQLDIPFNQTHESIPATPFFIQNTTSTFAYKDYLIKIINNVFQSWLPDNKTFFTDFSKKMFNTKLNPFLTFDSRSLSDYIGFTNPNLQLPEILCFPILGGGTQTRPGSVAFPQNPAPRPSEQLRNLIILIENNASLEEIQEFVSSLNDDTLNMTLNFSGDNLLTAAMDCLAPCEIILYLLQILAPHNVNRMSNRIGMTPLMYFRANHASDEQIERLIQMGASETIAFNPREQLRRLIDLIESRNFASFELIRFLVNSIDDDTLNSCIDFSGTTALSAAIDNDAPFNVVLYLLNSGNVNRASIRSNQTPLMYFQAKGASDEQIEILRELGATGYFDEPVEHLEESPDQPEELLPSVRSARNQRVNPLFDSKEAKRAP